MFFAQVLSLEDERLTKSNKGVVYCVMCTGWLGVIKNVIQALPVASQSWSVRRILSVEVSSKAVDHILVDNGFKLPGKKILLASILGKDQCRHREGHVCIVSEKEGRERQEQERIPVNVTGTKLDLGTWIALL